LKTAARTAIISVLTLAPAWAASCSRASDHQSVEPVYDSATGKLRLLRYDSNGNGKIDTYRYMDGSRTVRIELDRDEDGRIDQWQHYDKDQRIEKLGFSLRNDGVEDAWTYLDANGAVARVESSPHRDGRMSRVEHYERGRLVSAEEDTDADGRVDKWETYADGRLTMVAFDTAHSGEPDRRIVYDADGNGRAEENRNGAWLKAQGLGVTAQTRLPKP